MCTGMENVLERHVCSFCFGSSYTYARTHTHAHIAHDHIAHAFRWPRNAHIHTCTHIRTDFHARFYHTHTHHFYALLYVYIPFTHLPSTYICCRRRSFTISFLFLHFPSHLYLSFAAYWKKLPCGVIRSFNYSEFLIIKKSAGSWHWPHCHKNEMCRFRLFPAVYRCSILQTVRENAGDNTLIPAGHVLVCISLASR